MDSAQVPLSLCVNAVCFWPAQNETKIIEPMIFGPPLCEYLPPLGVSLSQKGSLKKVPAAVASP